MNLPDCPHCDCRNSVELLPPKYACSGCGKSWTADDGVPLGPAITTPTAEARASSPSILDVSGNVITGP